MDVFKQESFYYHQAYCEYWQLVTQVLHWESIFQDDFLTKGDFLPNI